MAQDNKQLLAKVTQQNQRITGEAPAPAKRSSLELMFEQRQAKFAEALAGSGMTPERFIRILITEVAGSQDLQRIAVNNPASLLGACMEMAQLGLDPSIPNEVYLIAYGNDAVCQTGYKGLAKLAQESARDLGTPLTVLRADIVYENDFYEREYGDTPRLTHRPPPFGKSRGKVIGYVAVAKDVTGRMNFREMTVEEVQKHKNRFSRAKRGPFTDPANFDSYGLKTVLRLLVSKDLSMGPKLARSQQLDLDAPQGPIIPRLELSTDTVVDIPSPIIPESSIEGEVELPPFPDHIELESQSSASEEVEAYKNSIKESVNLETGEILEKKLPEEKPAQGGFSFQKAQEEGRRIQSTIKDKKDGN